MTSSRSKNLLRTTFRDKLRPPLIIHRKVYVDDANKVKPGLQAGLFAKRLIRKGETIFIAKGKKIYIDVRTKKQSSSYPNAIGIKKGWWLDPEPGNPLNYLNHSCAANVGIKGEVTFVALRDIKKDEHLTLDYSISENDPLWTLGRRCKCGSKKCRKIIRSIQSLPVTLYKKYLPFIPEIFQRSYKEAHPRLKL